MPASINDLPVELLESIIGLILVHSQPPPKSPSESPNRTRVKDKTGLAKPFGQENVKFEKRSDKWISNGRSLLLANRRIHAVTKSVMERAGGQHYELDVMVVDEQELWPTWTYLSAPAQHIDKVHVTFRIFGTAKTSREQWVAERSGRAPEIGWAFYHLLERCVKAGPLSERSVRNGRKSREMTVKRLSIHVGVPVEESRMAPPNIWFRRWFHAYHSIQDAEDPPFFLPNPSNHLLMRPEWLGHIIDKCVKGVIKVSPAAHRYGKVIFEHVGHISIGFDAVTEEFGSGDPEEKQHQPEMFLQVLQYAPHRRSWGSAREEAAEFYRWKRETSQKRKLAGLPVIIEGGGMGGLNELLYG